MAAMPSVGGIQKLSVIGLTVAAFGVMASGASAERRVAVGLSVRRSPPHGSLSPRRHRARQRRDSRPARRAAPRPPGATPATSVGGSADRTLRATQAPSRRHAPAALRRPAEPDAPAGRRHPRDTGARPAGRQPAEVHGRPAARDARERLADRRRAGQPHRPQGVRRHRRLVKFASSATAAINTPCAEPGARVGQSRPHRPEGHRQHDPVGRGRRLAQPRVGQCPDQARRPRQRRRHRPRQAEAFVNGIRVSEARFSPDSCRELTAGDATVDLRSDAGLHLVGAVALPLKTMDFPDGPDYELEVRVTDFAGNVGVPRRADRDPQQGRPGHQRPDAQHRHQRRADPAADQNPTTTTAVSPARRRSPAARRGSRSRSLRSRCGSRRARRCCRRTSATASRASDVRDQGQARLGPEAHARRHLQQGRHARR